MYPEQDDEDPDESGEDQAAASYGQEDREETKQIVTTEEPTQLEQNGALNFRPKLKEYLIDTSEEGLDETLLYVRQARRLAYLAKNP